MRDDLATARTELEQATLELEPAVKVNESLTHSVYQLEDRIVSQECVGCLRVAGAAWPLTSMPHHASNVVGEMRATIDDQATQLAAPPRIVPMWPELPPKHEPKLKRFLDEIVVRVWSRGRLAHGGLCFLLTTSRVLPRPRTQRSRRLRNTSARHRRSSCRASTVTR